MAKNSGFMGGESGGLGGAAGAPDYVKTCEKRRGRYGRFIWHEVGVLATYGS